MRSETALDVLHQGAAGVLRLDRLAPASARPRRHPLNRTSQVFLCPFDVEETDEAEPIAASQVRLDEVLQERGDRLSYLYDYGDNWEVALMGGRWFPASPTHPLRRPCAASDRHRRRNCGGRADLAGLAQVVDDPEHVDLAGVNGRLREYLAIQRLDPRVMPLVHRLVPKSSGKDVLDLVAQLPDVPEQPSDSALSDVLGGFLWFLEVRLRRWAAVDVGGVPETGRCGGRPSSHPTDVPVDRQEESRGSDVPGARLP